MFIFYMDKYGKETEIYFKQYQSNRKMPNLLQYDENYEKKHLPNLLSKFTKCQFQTRHFLIQFICFLFPLPFVELFFSHFEYSNKKGNSCYRSEQY